MTPTGGTSSCESDFNALVVGCEKGLAELVPPIGLDWGWDSQELVPPGLLALNRDSQELVPPRCWF
jgi:hypothetical protein